MLSDLKKTNPNNRHPRLLATEEMFDRIKRDLKTNPHVQRMYRDILQVAADALSKPVTTYQYLVGDVRKLTSPGIMRAKLEPLLMAYILSGDEVYARRAWRELEAVCSFADWNEDHFLDAAEMTSAVALSYDWLYSYLSEEERRLVRTAIVEKGLLKARSAYDGTAEGDFLRKGWVTVGHNWNLVCNGGISMGAMAVGDEEEELCGFILEQSLRSIRHAAHVFGPDGGFVEGVGYWSYAVRHLVGFLAAMETALGTDYGYSRLPGIGRTGYFPAYLTGPMGHYNFADAGDGFINAPELFYFARLHKDPDLAGVRLRLLTEQHLEASFRDLLWYDPAHCHEDVRLPPDACFRGANAGSLRSGWDVQAAYVAFHAGKNNDNHQHMDNGGFIYDALGERWIEDLGKENYDLPGFFEHSSGERRRWHYYRNRTEGHNTLVFNPDLRPGQDPEASGDIVRLEANHPAGAIAVLDLTGPYRDYVKELKRGFFLADNRRILVVQDELETKEASDVWSFLQTRAEIEVLPGGLGAVLRKNGKRLYLAVRCSSGSAAISVSAADNLPTSPVSAAPGRELPRDMYNRLCIHVKDAGRLTLTMTMIPLEEPDSLPDSIPKYGPISAWGVEEPSLAYLTGIYADGVLLKDFSARSYHYKLELPWDSTAIPVITAAGEEPYAIELPDKLPGTARIFLSRTPANSLPAAYYVRMERMARPPVPGKDGSMKELLVAIATMADYERQAAKGNHAGHTLDGDMNTIWSDEPGRWLQYDLGAMQNVEAVAIAWFNGSRLRYGFAVAVSADGAAWTTVYRGHNTRTADGYETYLFPVIHARYIRIITFGSAINKHAAIAEARVLSKGI